MSKEHKSLYQTRECIKLDIAQTCISMDAEGYDLVTCAAPSQHTVRYVLVFKLKETCEEDVCACGPGGCRNDIAI